MSLLYPLFLAGVAAIGLPILLHMVRRHTRQRVAFSSLMFLRTSLPRLRNRSRLEHLLLLALRCMALGLVALAFARPFFDRWVTGGPAQAGLGRRIVLLVDTSASMRRTGVWEQAVREARSALEEAGPMDHVCVMAFDQDTRTVSGFEQWDALDPGRRVQGTLQQVSSLSPTWAGTRLGQALVAAAEVLEDAEVSEGQGPGSGQVVLVSDLQQGSRLEALQGFEWPAGTELAVRQVRCPDATNATMQWVVGPSADQPTVRVTNSADSDREQFQIGWADAGSPREPNASLTVYVAPGRSVVVRAPARAGPADPGRLVLTGDDHAFDNTLHWAPGLRRSVRVLVLGPDDPNDPKGMLYYLRQAMGSTDGEGVHVVWRSGLSGPVPSQEVESAHLVVIAGPVEGQSGPVLRRHIESGHTALLVARSPEASTTLAALAGGAAPRCEEVTADQGRAGTSDRGYAMLAGMDLGHPLLAPFRDPRYGDFTRIHFWRYRRVHRADCPGAKVLAWFDSNDPALFEMGVGRGTLLVLTSGWAPSDSDLALSSKFVPLLYSVLDHAGAPTGRQPQYFVGDPVPIQTSAGPASSLLEIRRPDGSSVRAEVGQTFSRTDLPGVYTIESPAEAWSFAVNLPAEEGRTSPMPVEDLESLGVSLRPSSDLAAAAAVHAVRRDGPAVLEGQQKVWRWVLGAALAVVLVEIGLAGRKMKEGGQP